MSRTKIQKVDKGCCNCRYSAENKIVKYYCVRKAGEMTRVSEEQWLKNDCSKWEYDGVSEWFDAEEEYNKMPENA